MSEAAHDFETLAVRYLDGVCTAEEFAALDRLLRGDAERQRAFIDLALTRRALYESLRPRVNSERGTANMQKAMDRTHAVVPRSAFRVPRFLLAAALLIAACAVVIYALSVGPKSEIPNSQATLASVLDVTDGTLLIDDQIASAGERYAGRTVSLDAGEAEFMLASGASVQLRGRSALTIHSPMQATLTRGAADFVCPPSAKGFTVDLPGGGRVIDLGTAFAIDVDAAGDALVRVTDGSIRVEGRSDSVVVAAPGVLRVVAGNILRLDGAIAESFDRATIPTSLESIGSTPVELSDGAARFAGAAHTERTYLRTVATDWTTRSFTAEVSVRVTTRSPVGLPHFGLARGDIAPGYFFAPFAGPHLVAILRTDADAIHIYDGRGFTGRVTSLGLVQHPLPGGLAVPGTHRLRLRWDAESATASFALDRDADGSVDWTATLDGSDNGFDATNARIVLGGAGGVEFDDLTIVPDGEPRPSIQPETDRRRPVPAPSDTELRP